MRKLLLPLVCTILSITACTIQPGVRSALRLAGENRGEMEAVLKHYSAPEDKQKKKAAEYLIRYMPGHVSVSGNWKSYSDSISTIFSSGVTAAEKISRANAATTNYNPEFSQDIKTLTADYLIWNIDRSFEMWQNSPYLQHLNFDEFCETVLPYKCFEGQPADRWKDYAAEYGADIRERMSQIDEWRFGVRAAVENVNEAFGLDMSKPLLKPEGLKDSPLFDIEGIKNLPYNTCLEMSKMGVILGRANGLPVNLEFLPNWPLQEQSHYWNEFRAENGREFDYIPFEIKPQDAHHIDKRRAKAYRKCYAPDRLLWQAMQDGVKLPRPFSDPFIRDVSEKYNLVSDIKVPIKGCRDKYACLAVFDNERWMPVQIGRIKGGKAYFKKVGREVLYIVLSLSDNGAQKGISGPFILDIKGNMQPITPLKNAGTQDITIDRKFPAFVHIWPFRETLTGFVLEASSTPDFSTCIEAARWEDTSLFSSDRYFKLDSPYRYWRIRGLWEGPITLAEFYFYSNGERIKPVSIQGRQVDRLFDSNEVTSMWLRTDIYAQVDFETPVLLDRAAVIRRGDGNCVKPGDTYQLYYWDDNGWTLFQEKEADDIRITFKDVPAGRLYRIRDITKGKQHRTFIYKDGKCVWY